MSGSSRSLEWHRGAPITQEAVSAVEDRLGVRFPEDYRSCILLNDGGTPDKTEFPYTHPELGEFGGCFGALLSLASEGPNSVIWTVEALSDRLPPLVIPIMEDPGGDCVCLDFRSAGSTASYPPLVYWSHDSRPEISLTFLANAFTDFLDMLH